MVDPGTAAIAVLSTIAGVSGYGAMKLNAKQRELVEDEITKRVATIEQAKQAAEAEILRLRTELEMLRRAATEQPPPPLATEVPPPAAEQVPPPAADQTPPPAAEQVPPPAAEQVPPPAATEESPETNAERPVTEDERARCRETLERRGIRTRADWRKWSRRNRDSPDLPDVNNCADIVLKGRAGGTSRKNKLRTRRKTIQNGRRTRGGKNRANRTHPNAR